MFIVDIVKTVNRLLAGETLTYEKMVVYLDEVVDEINAQLCSSFPTISETVSLIEESAGESVSLAVIDYNCFPNRYIRSVLCKGAAYKFYVQDEEGIITADKFGWDYKDALFIMLRDYATEVPTAYQNDIATGYPFDEYRRSTDTPFAFDIFGSEEE